MGVRDQLRASNGWLTPTPRGKSAIWYEAVWGAHPVWTLKR
jgi:hypothetical protein